MFVRSPSGSTFLKYSVDSGWMTNAEAALTTVAAGPQQPGFELSILNELSEGRRS
jgi:hypothetical protein